MAAATAAVRSTRITAVAIAEVGAAAIGAVVITHLDPTTTWRLSPTPTTGRSRTTGRATGHTTGRATTTVRLRHLASAASSGSNRGRSLYGMILTAPGVRIPPSPPSSLRFEAFSGEVRK